MSIPTSLHRSKTTLFLFVLKYKKLALFSVSLIPFGNGPKVRLTSPTTGRSILTVSAPRSARIFEANGPDIPSEISRTRTPFSSGCRTPI